MRAFLLAAVVITVLPAPALAAPETSEAPDNGGLVDDPSLTPEVMLEVDRATEAKERACGLGIRPDDVTVSGLNRYGYITRPVTNYTQERTYWCGPAAARQTLSFHMVFRGSAAPLPSQSTLATKIGTTPSGSSTANIVSVLNSYDGIFGRMLYIGSNVTGQTTPVLDCFWNRIGNGLFQPSEPYVTICLMQTSRIPRYGGHRSRHYMTISGIDDTTATRKMRSVDPHYNSAYRGIYWDPVGSTTVNSLCRACYQADLDGTNLVMCW